MAALNLLVSSMQDAVLAIYTRAVQEVFKIVSCLASHILPSHSPSLVSLFAEEVPGSGAEELLQVGSGGVWQGGACVH